MFNIDINLNHKIIEIDRGQKDQMRAKGLEDVVFISLLAKATDKGETIGRGRQKQKKMMMNGEGEGDGDSGGQTRETVEQAVTTQVEV